MQFEVWSNGGTTDYYGVTFNPHRDHGSYHMDHFLVSLSHFLLWGGGGFEGILKSNFKCKVNYSAPYAVYEFYIDKKWYQT